MKKKIIAIVVISMFLLTSFSIFVVAEKQSSSNQIILSYSFEKPVIEKVDIGGGVYNRVNMSDAPCGGNPGEPRLPARGAYILLPQGTKVNDIRVVYSEKICLGSGFKVEPVGEPVPLSKVSSGPLPVPDEAIYSSEDMFPDRLFTEVGTYCFRGYNILVLRLNPIQYIPYSGELFYYPDLTVSVETSQNNNINSLFRESGKDKLEVMKKVDNSNVAATYTQISPKIVSTEEYDLLIITNESLKNGFMPLKQAHDAEGVKTLIYTVEDIYNNHSGDDAENVRNFIRDAYNNWGIEYVLLGGDDDVVPARELYFGFFRIILWFWEDEYGISDLYYACLDGSFNYDGDEKWGEPTDGENGGDVDLIAEVYVGRACVGSEMEVGNFVNKTIAYMNTDPDDEYIKDVLMFGEYLSNLWGPWGPPWGPACLGGTYMEELIDGCEKWGYTTVGIPSSKYNIYRLYERRLFRWPKFVISNRINKNVHIINHLGHSYYSNNMKLSRSDVKALTNDKYCFIYSQGCMAGEFDNPYDDCIAEYLTVKTKHGAFAGIWNAGFGFGNDFTTDGPSQRFHREFWDAVFGENITVISKANQDSKEDNLWRINNNYMRYVYYELNLFGDPAVQFKLSNSNNNQNSQNTQQSQNSPRGSQQSNPLSSPSSQQSSTSSSSQLLQHMVKTMSR